MDVQVGLLVVMTESTVFAAVWLRLSFRNPFRLSACAWIWGLMQHISISFRNKTISVHKAPSFSI